MDDEVKVSELTEANIINDQDEFMIVQNSTNKRIQFKNIKNNADYIHNYSLEIDADKTAGQEITIPCNYKVGAEVLDVYLNGERLIRSSDDAGTNGHYVEVGTADSISNKIKSTTDWNLEADDVLDLVVRGEYSDTIS